MLGERQSVRLLPLAAQARLEPRAAEPEPEPTRQDPPEPAELAAGKSSIASAFRVFVHICP